MVFDFGLGFLLLRFALLLYFVVLTLDVWFGFEPSCPYKRYIVFTYRYV